MESPAEALLASLRIIPDPRVNRTLRHPLESILFVAICGVLCGAESWIDLEAFGVSRKEWLSRHVDLPNGIPSHDTFGRVFAQLDPQALQGSLLLWVKAAALRKPGEVVAIDGKTLRGSHNRSQGQRPLHLVSAWAEANHLMLGQVRTEEKSNEIEAIPRLLEMLDLKKCTVTLDAMGTQGEIAQKIRDKEADYVLCLKGNQGVFHEEVKAFWEDSNLKESDYQTHETLDRGHGRVEKRRYRISDQIQRLSFERNGWVGLKTIGMVESERRVGSKTSLERRLFLSSLNADATRFAEAVRAHWKIENELHWSMDVLFDEDQCRVRVKHAAENFALLRRIALHLLKKEHSSPKRSVRGKRLKAAWEPAYLEVILGTI